MHIIELKHIPLLEQRPEKELITVQVREVMARNLVTFEVVETLENLIDTLESCRHNGFPVVFPGTMRLAGVLRRSVLHRLLETCREHDILQEPEGELRELPPIRFEAMASQQPGKYDTYDQLRAELEPALLRHRIDLKPYINRNGYMMPRHASVASCFQLFRKLGLRHLPVVASNGDVCGMVTRKDLILCEEDHEHLPEPESPISASNSEEEEAEEEEDHEESENEVSEADPEDVQLNPTGEGGLLEERPERVRTNRSVARSRKVARFRRDSGFFGGGSM
mmetsp:Transcript_66382/g.197524  ORF Transcript_66382/g.197524 Transcript_66382/m.197524 type:complete len:280 (-) Transcript_66382:15-854(-)